MNEEALIQREIEFDPFYLDEDIPLALGSQLRNAGHDVAHVRDLRTKGRTDSYHLTTATDDGRILVTHNAKDFLLLHDAWCRWTRHWGVHQEHRGILLLPQVQANDRYFAIDLFLRSDLPTSGQLYVFDPALSWVRQSYQP